MNNIRNKLLFAILILFSSTLAQNLNQKKALILHSEGIKLIRQEKYIEALEKLAGASALDIENSSYLVDLGWVQERLGNKKEALHLYQKAVKVDPTYGAGLNNLALLLAFEENNLDEGLSLVKKACELEPQNPIFLDSYAIILERMGKNDEALEIFKKALQIAPNNIPLLENLLLFSKRNKRDKLAEDIQHNLNVLKQQQNFLPSDDKKKDEKQIQKEIIKSSDIIIQDRKTDKSHKNSIYIQLSDKIFNGHNISSKAPKSYDQGIEKYFSSQFQEAEKLLNSAIIELRRGGGSKDTIIEAYRFLSLIDIKKGEWDSAKANWKKADAIRILILGEAYLRFMIEEKVDDALKVIAEAEKKDNPYFLSQVLNIAKSKLNGENIKKDGLLVPMPDFQTSFSGQITGFFFNRGTELFKSQLFEQGVEELEKATQFSDAGAEIFLLLAWHHINLGEYDSAIDRINQSYYRNGGFDLSATADNLLAAIIFSL